MPHAARFAWALFILLALLFFGCARQDSGRVLVSFPAHPSLRVDAELARTPLEQEVGLMNRTRLAPDEGMLFSYADERPRAFWMRDTNIPLDILFISSDGKIVDVQTMKPCLDANASLCPVYYSARPARFALEVNSGFAKAHGIAQGELVRIG